MVSSSKSLIECKIKIYLTLGEQGMGITYKEALGHGACLRVKVVWIDIL